MKQAQGKAMKIAVVGAGISGLSAAWLLSQKHHVVLFEAAPRLGGHANTVCVAGNGGETAVDTGFIVYNEATYPNFVALMDHLRVTTQPTEMSFAVSLEGGRLEYSGTNIAGLFAQRSNLVRPRFWAMLQDIKRFYRNASRDTIAGVGANVSLGDYIAAGGYGAAFRDDHLLPMAAAIWSAPCSEILSYPAAAFLRFHHNHGLLQLTDRPVWRTVSGGSAIYVEKLRKAFAGEIRTGVPVTQVLRGNGEVLLSGDGWSEVFDNVVFATHADQTLTMLADPDPAEVDALAAFRYSRNRAVLHGDSTLMPKRRRAWASWNHIGDRAAPDAACAVTYWMNRLQGLPEEQPFFVTLNPPDTLRSQTILHEESYEHPLFDAAALRAQSRLWSLQGNRHSWFCGAYFGSGFHEDGLQAGLAVAEALGGVRRPWRVGDESGRIPSPAVTEQAA
ncbi:MULTISPECIES: FAD-dependent oxidoreductase [unclassified Chelatococcus]|uniref:NAD(P)/FAD-dependent oxidoreductase n=1 Tax=unclassified Chelatococcus TaxID=2638111 RepID=UPI001BCDB7D6|nr:MULTISPECIES: FAD-dependent oxidoreductase [unclassified Chelatococcus]CAH1655792.1 Amine oxidase, flavin-containing [Hyphomicrobiales bacterium]MBS7742555.1 FAD-dependent oxidoreductase [Chelatococcus sp. HY11]MBX3542327.1 FAD-dependent oxidoreductase [Chelatococcus sp.]MCO5075455.1 FAD-dependent oxidoreductase [Chelatococcus sp.]CAH1695637.1 Amine oxidase, flavin-containing [Hyphomicrobiales bacterium]